MRTTAQVESGVRPATAAGSVSDAADQCAVGQGLGPNLVSRDGLVYLIDDFLSAPQAQILFDLLQAELAWEREAISVAGRCVLVPRLVCWYGDPSARYRYSGVDHQPIPWTGTLTEIRSLIEHRVGTPFNSVLGNYYRNGSDSMGWHADKEAELGTNPTIASLSLGESRRFLLRHNRTHEQCELKLVHGSLLVMAGSLQHHWRHCVPKTRATEGSRINLTFRYIHRRS